LTCIREASKQLDDDYHVTKAVERLSVTPSLELTDDRWSDLTTTPTAASPFIKTGDYSLLALDATYQVTKNIQNLVRVPELPTQCV
jgi:hypothetical protein